MASPATMRPGFVGSNEPKLSDLLADPILHLLMRSDRLSERDLRVAIARGRAALLRSYLKDTA